MFLREKKEKLVFDLQLLLFTYKNTRGTLQNKHLI